MENTEMLPDANEVRVLTDGFKLHATLIFKLSLVITTVALRIL